VPSEKEVKENGLSLGQSDAVLLQKIEELTLYLIEQNKENKEQSEKIKELEEENKKLKAELEQFKKFNEKLIKLEKQIEKLNSNN
jgi:predicted RNase H-like nuclease (RuvC/YqgF family)